MLTRHVFPSDCEITWTYLLKETLDHSGSSRQSRCLMCSGCHPSPERREASVLKMFRRARVFTSANVQQPTARCWEKRDLSVRLQCHRVFLSAIRNFSWNDAAVRVFLSSGVTRDSDRVSSSSLITSTPKTAALKSARRAKFSVRFPPRIGRYHEKGPRSLQAQFGG